MSFILLHGEAVDAFNITFSMDTIYSISHMYNCTIVVNLKVKAIHLKQREVVNDDILVYSCQFQWDWAERKQRYIVLSDSCLQSSI